MQNERCYVARNILGVPIDIECAAVPGSEKQTWKACRLPGSGFILRPSASPRPPPETAWRVDVSSASSPVFIGHTFQHGRGCHVEKGAGDRLSLNLATGSMSRLATWFGSVCSLGRSDLAQWLHGYVEGIEARLPANFTERAATLRAAARRWLTELDLPAPATAPASGNALATCLLLAGCGDVLPIVPPEAPPNQPPVVSGELPYQRLPGPGATVHLDVAGYFTDPDGGELTFSATSSDTAVVTASTAGSVLTLTGGAIGGAARVTVTARDLDGAEASGSIGVEVNRRPVASEIPGQSLVGDTEPLALDVAGYFADPDGDALTFAAASSDTAVVAISTAGTVLTLTGGATGGEARVTVTVRDPDGLEAVASFPVVVADALFKKYPIFVHQIRGSNDDPHSDPQKITTFNQAIEQISIMLGSGTVMSDSVYVSNKRIRCRGLSFEKGDTIKQGIHLSAYTDTKIGNVARITPCTDSSFVGLHNVFGGRIEYQSGSAGSPSVWAHEIFHLLIDMMPGGEAIYDDSGKWIGARIFSEHPVVDSIWRYKWQEAEKTIGTSYEGKLPIDDRYGTHWHECAAVSKWISRHEAHYDIMSTYGSQTDSIIITPITQAALVFPLGIHDEYISDYHVYNPNTKTPIYPDSCIGIH